MNVGSPIHLVQDQQITTIRNIFSQYTKLSQAHINMIYNLEYRKIKFFHNANKIEIIDKNMSKSCNKLHFRSTTCLSEQVTCINSKIQNNNQEKNCVNEII